MKTKYPSMFGILAAILLVASFVVPSNFVGSVAADPGICKWDTLREPGGFHGAWVVGFFNGFNTDIIDFDAASDGTTMATIVHLGLTATTHTTAAYLNRNSLFMSMAQTGLFWSQAPYNALATSAQANFGGIGARNLFQVRFAPDNPQFIVVTGSIVSAVTGPREVFVSTNGGAQWRIANLDAYLTSIGDATSTIRDIDVSVDYGGQRDIIVVTANGAGAGRVVAIQTGTFGSWATQIVAPLPLPGAVDYFAIKISPSYASDAAYALVFADAARTYYNVALRDVANNRTAGWAFTTPGPVVVAGTAPLASPTMLQLNKAVLDLPSDFSGQAASLRRAYISLDTYNAGAAKVAWDGIVRFDNMTAYILMDTSSDPTKSIYDIAYYGTYASGKLLAADRIGYPCDATVPTYFTDSPTTCPIPCWYDALKPTTGATCCTGTCALGAKDGVGAGLVEWRWTNGQLAFAATGSLAVTTGAAWFAPLIPAAWACANDESAFAISRNNGETWNQLSMIDTTITRFTDVAPTADCKTIFLASVNGAGATTGCCNFDSVWRTSSNPDVVSPLTPLPVGTYWERVFTHTTSVSCNVAQTNIGLLRVVPYCEDPTGEIVGWAAMNSTAAAWSPDFGDYWAMITVRNAVQDFAFMNRTMLLFLSPAGLVQKMPYTGTAWSTTIPDINSLASAAHTIAAYPEGNALVGWALPATAAFTVSYSNNMDTANPTFTTQSLSGNTGRAGNIHVAFDPQFVDNYTYFIAEENSAGLGGSVYRNNPTAQLRWSDTDMMAATNGAFGCPAAAFAAAPTTGFTGIVLAFTGEALYVSSGAANGGVWRTIDDGTGKFGPLSGMPKPGIAWDQLVIGIRAGDPNAGAGLIFTAQPTALKACGCCTLETDTVLYAIDNNAYDAPILRNAGNMPWGLIWSYTDCLAKRGPTLITEDKTLIGCDPVSGRAQEVNLCWEQLCISDAYDVEIAKKADFSIKVIDWVAETACAGFLVPADVTIPCAYVPSGGTLTLTPSDLAISLSGVLECGHTYWWRVKARQCATTEIVRSPWSEVRQFTVKAGLPVTTPYYGPQLLAPNNGCLGCPVAPASFSWSPFKETTKYKFVLAKDAAMTQVVKEAEVTTTAFEYDGTLDNSVNYFWRVMALEPAPSDWSATFSFQTEAPPPTPAGPEEAAPTPLWVWVVIAIGAILVIVTLVLIFKTRRV